MKTDSTIKNVTIYTDGACSVNPGVGGWAAILIYKEKIKEISGAEENTTNNRMELLAIINGLKMLKERCIVSLYSDSAYSVNAINEGWIATWQALGWRTAAKKAVKNVDLWQELLQLLNKHNVTFIKVKGHAENQLNNRCDALARAAVQNLKKRIAQDDEAPF